MNVGKKLSLGFGIVLALMIVTVILGISRLNEINFQVNDMVNEHIKKKDLLNIWQQSIIENTANAVAALQSDEPGAVSYYLGLIDKNSDRISDVVKVLDTTLKNNNNVPADMKEFYADALAKRNIYSTERKHLFDMKQASGKVEAESHLKDLLSTIDAYKAAVNKLSDIYSDKTQRDYIAIQKGYSLGYTILLAGGLIGLILGVIVAFILTRRITKPLHSALWIAENVSQGNLDLDYKGPIPRDEIGALILSLRRMKLNLRKAVYEIREDADAVNTAASEIASGNLDLSSRTEQQASSLEETAASMEELTTTVKQNSDNATQANNLVVKAVKTADDSGALATQAVDTMEKITSSSHKMAEIISVIDGIAFQTNILALNASVEAARAGEQGRGFAVVATEVRNLAQRSAAAAKEIKELIDYSVTTVDEGHLLVNKVGSSIQEIITEVKRVSDIVGEISAASKEQSAGIEQVNQAVMQLDQVTQQNAALVEQSAAAAESMQSQSTHLVSVVDVFKLPENMSVKTIDSEQAELKSLSHFLKLDKNARMLEKAK